MGSLAPPSLPKPGPRLRSAVVVRALLARALLAALLLLAFPARVAAQPHPAPTASAAAPAPEAAVPEAAPDSPRVAIKQFLELCKDGEYAEAAEYLDLSDKNRPIGPEFAQRLKAVLDRQIWVKLDSISPLSTGRLDDGLPPSVEEIGSVPGKSGLEPVRLIRKNRPEGPRWLFSRATVDRINDWYNRLQDRWLREYLPEALLRPGPYELTWWQWAALPLLLAIAYGFGKALDRITRRLLRRIFAARHITDAFPFLRLGGPLTLAWALILLSIFVPRLGLYPPAEASFDRVILAGFIADAFWFGLRALDVIRERLLARPSAQENPATRSLVPLGAKAGKLVVFAFAAVAVLSQLGIPVTSILAGFGIGGVVLALAAQKTVENLLGSLSIGIDQPFRVGDYIEVEGVKGTVEAIGLRSTRIRTLDRTLVTIANGKLADMRIESYAARDKYRLHCFVGLVYETRPSQMREVIERIRSYLEQHSMVWPEPMIVHFAELGDWSLNIEVMIWFKTTDWIEYRKVRQEVLFRFLEIIEQAGTSVAFPTRMLHFANMPRADLPFDEPPASASGNPIRA